MTQFRVEQSHLMDDRWQKFKQKEVALPNIFYKILFLLKTSSYKINKIENCLISLLFWNDLIQNTHKRIVNKTKIVNRSVYGTQEFFSIKYQSKYMTSSVMSEFIINLHIVIFLSRSTESMYRLNAFCVLTHLNR